MGDGEHPQLKVVPGSLPISLHCVNGPIILNRAALDYHHLPFCASEWLPMFSVYAIFQMNSESQYFSKQLVVGDCMEYSQMLIIRNIFGPKF